VELLIPILDEKIREELRTILEIYFRDNTQAWELSGEGTWKRLDPGTDKPFKAQSRLLAMAEKEAAKPWKIKQEFTIRRSPPPGA
jgi:polyphosphate kinase